MEARTHGLARTSEAAGPAKATGPFFMSCSEMGHPRQTVAQQPCLRTFRQECGTYAMSENSVGGCRASRRRSYVFQSRTAFEADLTVGGGIHP